MGLGDGVGVGGTPAAPGVTMMSAVAERSKVTLGPPVKIHISGVSSWKWPVTVTVTVLP